VSDLRWNLEKVEVEKEKIDMNMFTLQWSVLDPSLVTEDLVWKCLYLKGIAKRNYDLGGHWAIETMNLLDFEKNGEVKCDCLGWFLLSPKNPDSNLRKAVRMMASHCILIESHGREVAATAF